MNFINLENAQNALKCNCSASFSEGRTMKAVLLALTLILLILLKRIGPTPQPVPPPREESNKTSSD